MAYKIVPWRRKVQTLVHMALHTAALLVASLGLFAVFKSRRGKGAPDMYSLHSWIGLGAFCLYALQWMLGFFSFLYPRAEKPTRAKLLPWHAFAGAAIFLTGVCAAEMGLLQRFNSLGLTRGGEALVVNLTGLAILFFAVAVVLTVILPAGGCLARVKSKRGKDSDVGLPASKLVNFGLWVWDVNQNLQT